MDIRGPGCLVAVALAGALLLVSCAGNGLSPAASVSSAHPSAVPSGPAGRFNDADVMFVQQMIPHHQQAIQMARMAAHHAQDAQVKALATRIQTEQASEINTMSIWLRAWGRPVPTGMPGTMSPMPRMTSQMPGMMTPMPGMMPGAGGPSMPGMMSQQEMSQLMAAHGADFDRMFLGMMIRHHQGAIEMARTEQAEGVNPAARTLARQIETGQTAEIAQMQHMLQQRPSSPA